MKKKGKKKEEQSDDDVFVNQGVGGDPPEPPYFPSSSSSSSSKNSRHSHHSSHKASFKKALSKLDAKFSLPMFNGDVNPETLDNWIRQLKYIVVFNILMKRKLK
jgi:site-specific DNA-adenine methylase